MALVFVLLVSLVFAVFVNAKCENPAVRKEWRTLSTAEKAEWIRSVKCLANLPHDPALTPSVPVNISNIVPVDVNGSYYDDIVYMHMVVPVFSVFVFPLTCSRVSNSLWSLSYRETAVDLNTRIHFTGLFLPWHRWYVAVYEQALKEKCGFTGTSPYWNWVEDSKDVFDSPFFKDYDPESGLGGWGDPENDFSVPNGGFSNTSSFKLVYPSPHTLRRNFTLQPFLGSPFLTNPAQQALYANATFTPAQYHKLVYDFVGDYKGFQTYFEGFNGSHGAVHLMMGGDLGGNCPKNAPAGCVNGSPTFSANEPLFWMHHAMVDRVWYEWQHASPENADKYFGGSVEALENVTYYMQYPTGAPPYLSTNFTMPADGMFSEARIADVLSTTEGMLCYVYD
uniref:Di-copper centre-containing protein n=1 Tax=Mycena chlorophos TaxID=658473 RepID=A0ABQ0M510_MYCCL|nr:di-copper centre-containing protein [Mycena chlorophos]